jgi:hypothetical protein
MEIHKHRHNFVKHHSIHGRINPIVQIEPISMERRHNKLAREMIIRKMNHKSDYNMPDISYLPNIERTVKVNISLSLTDLAHRCTCCAERIREYSK